MRLADIQLTVPAILIALTLDGVARAALPKNVHDEIAIWVLVLSIGFAYWPQFARVTRATTLAEKNKDYVNAARIIGVQSPSLPVRTSIFIRAASTTPSQTVVCTAMPR